MQDHTVDESLIFSFPDDWLISKYDEWAFYKNQFSCMNDGIKAVDLLAVDLKGLAGATVWFIEAKDYRKNPRKNPIPIVDEIWKKVYDTLAGMLPAQFNAVNNEQKHARKVTRCKKMRVVLHLERPDTPSKLFPAKYYFADLQKKLRARLRPIDAHALVVSSKEMPSSLPWSVR